MCEFVGIKVLVWEEGTEIDNYKKYLLETAHIVVCNIDPGPPNYLLQNRFFKDKELEIFILKDDAPTYDLYQDFIDNLMKNQRKFNIAYL
jgi:hypothetical protein